MENPKLNELPNKWEFLPSDLALGEGEVHLWRVQLDLPPTVVDDIENVLSEAEREKAARYYIEADRARFTASKVCQRTVLGAYLGIAPGSVTFRVNSYGKPSLSGEHRDESLQFNLSHTRGLGLFAVARGSEIGVDIEEIRSREMDLGIAHRFFSQQEVKSLERLSAAEQKIAFYVCWTRKEAYIKARGQGLSFPLDKFSVSFEPDVPPILLSNDVDPEEVRRWDVYHIDLGDAYTGALVIRACPWTFKQFHWAGDVFE